MILKDLSFSAVKKLWPAWLTGLLLLLSYTPFGMWWLGYISLVPLWLAVRSAGSRRVVALCVSAGLLYGTVVYNSTLTFSIWFYLFLLLMFCCCLLLWASVSRHLLDRIAGPWAAVFLPPLVWVGMEAIVTNSAFGIPFNLGTIQAGAPVQIQSAALFGIYGISFLIVLGNCAVSEVLESLSGGASIDWRRILPSVVALLMLVVNIGYGYRQLHDQHDPGAAIKVATVQPVISTDMYRDGWRIPGNRARMKKVVDDLTLEAAQTGAQMVFWAEGGNGFLNLRVAALRDGLYRLAHDRRIDLVVSSNDIDGDGKKYNTVFTISNQGERLGRYDKVRLVPFAESDYTAGAELHTLPTSHASLGAMICFESTLPGFARELTEKGAQLLYVATSDAAFKRSSLVFGHAQLDIFRAVENGRWLVRAANTGPSMIVSPRGEIMHQAEFYRPGMVVGSVVPLTRLTFFTTTGYMAPQLCALITVLLALHAMVLRFSFGRIAGRSAIAGRKRGNVLAEDRVRGGLRIIGRLAAQAGVHVLLASLVVCASLYKVQKQYPESGGYIAALRDFIMPQTPVAERISARFLQAGSNTCGAAALAYMLSYFGHEITEDDVLRQVRLQPEGISMLDLKHVAEHHNFDAEGFELNYSALLLEPLPVIAHINDNHYVVINRVTDYHVLMFDPAMGNIKVSRPVFDNAWRGLILQLRMRPIAGARSDGATAHKL